MPANPQMISVNQSAGSSTSSIGSYHAMTRSRSLNGRVGRASNRNTCSTITKCTRVSHAFSARSNTIVRIADSSVRTTTIAPITPTTTRTTITTAFCTGRSLPAGTYAHRVLIRTAILERIVRGEIDTQFRRQRKPTVRAGGTLRTHLGMLDILEVERVELDGITENDAHRSGARSREEVIGELTKKPDGDFYRVRLRYAGEDPRLALRADDDLSDDDVATLTARLDRLDRSSATGAWTRAMLRM